MKNEVATIENKALSTMTADMAWGADEVESSDIRISRCLLMQPLSDLVQAGNASPGDIVDSITGTKLASKNETMSFVPIYIYKTWAIHEEENGKFEYKRTEDYTVDNSNYPKETVKVNGIPTKYVICINVLAMMEKDLTDPSAIPVLLTFRMTSFKAGQDVSTAAIRAKAIGKPASYFTVTMGSEFVKNDKGSFYVFKVKGIKPTAGFDEVAPGLFNWYKTFKSGRAKVDVDAVESDNIGTTGGSASEVMQKF